jgi:hypothetical protein
MSTIDMMQFELGDELPPGVRVVFASLREGGGITAIVIIDDTDGVLKHHHDCDEHHPLA